MGLLGYLKTILRIVSRGSIKIALLSALTFLLKLWLVKFCFEDKMFSWNFFKDILKRIKTLLIQKSRLMHSNWKKVIRKMANLFILFSRPCQFTVSCRIKLNGLVSLSQSLRIKSFYPTITTTLKPNDDENILLLPGKN